VGGNVNKINVSKSTEEFDVDIDGMLTQYLAGGSMDDADIYVYGGITDMNVAGVISSMTIDTRDWDGGGNPIGGGIGQITAKSIVDSQIYTHMTIGLINLKGALIDSTIDTEARNNNTNALVGGGSLEQLNATEMTDSTITTFGRINKINLFGAGMNDKSSIETLDAVTGNLNLMQVKGYIFGGITVAGNVGNIYSAGQNALPGPAPIDFLFVDSKTVPTGGQLTVAGLITGLIS
jgi:hypothetical protein